MSTVCVPFWHTITMTSTNNFMNVFHSTDTVMHVNWNVRHFIGAVSVSDAFLNREIYIFNLHISTQSSSFIAATVCMEICLIYEVNEKVVDKKEIYFIASVVIVKVFKVFVFVYFTIYHKICAVHVQNVSTIKMLCATQYTFTQHTVCIQCDTSFFLLRANVNTLFHFAQKMYCIHDQTKKKRRMEERVLKHFINRLLLIAFMAASCELLQNGAVQPKPSKQSQYNSVKAHSRKPEEIWVHTKWIL